MKKPKRVPKKLKFLFSDDKEDDPKKDLKVESIDERVGKICQNKGFNTYPALKLRPMKRSN